MMILWLSLRKPKKIPQKIDEYQIIYDDVIGDYYIKITTGKYKDVEYAYKEVSVIEDPKENFASLNFNVVIYDSNGFESLNENKDFINHAGEILKILILSNKDDDLEDVEYVEK